MAAACFNPKSVFNAAVMATHPAPSQSAEDYLERIKATNPKPPHYQ